MVNNSFPILSNTRHYLFWHQCSISGFATAFEAPTGFHHDLFCTLLSLRDPLLTIRNHSFKTNISILLRLRSKSQMETQSIKIFIDNSCGVQVSSFFWYPIFCKSVKTVFFSFFFWLIFNYVAMLQDEICQSTLIFLKEFYRILQRLPFRLRFMLKTPN